jgi:hypothetical protein
MGLTEKVHTDMVAAMKAREADSVLISFNEANYMRSLS